MFIKIDSVIFEDSLYPRNGLHWGQVQRYAEAIKTGAQFPPIVLGKNGGMVLIDGWHRFNAYKRCGKEKLAYVLSAAPKELWYAEAVRLNTQHGIPLSMQERLEACMRLQRQGLTNAEIEKLIAIPFAEVEKAILERGHWDKQAAKPVVIKQPLVPAARERGKVWLEKEHEAIEVAQKPLADSSHLHLLIQVKRMLEAKLLPRDVETKALVQSVLNAAARWMEETKE